MNVIGKLFRSNFAGQSLDGTHTIPLDGDSYRGVQLPKMLHFPIQIAHHALLQQLNFC